ncbi:MAG TPA: TIGR03557 family F420-dependent LLM class oxidoreductase [Anaerolineales bacterium]|nr:TIGR03557 family F420-dependent LLM class oxidoreductase [Anaerolineales bacterium]
MEIGYWLSSEEHTPNDLVRYARQAESIGFPFAQISDHYHPWIDSQGHSPFIWAVIGGIAQATERLRLQTAVTCPTMRIHPAVIAQAAATVAAMMPGRFMLGVGTGENLNEHILGDHWPPIETRQAMLKEAIEIIRLLWEGGLQSFSGHFYTVENARLYTLPDELPPIYLAASGPDSAELAGRVGDGLISTSPDAELVDTFNRAGGKGKACYGKIALCWADNESEARRTAHEIWPIAGLSAGALNTELALPSYFEQAVQMVTEDQVAEKVICGPDPEPCIAAIRKYAEAGFDYVSLHQIGPDQEGFFDFYQRELSVRIQKVV